jgi:hypothetical protein
LLWLSGSSGNLVLRIKFCDPRSCPLAVCLNEISINNLVTFLRGSTERSRRSCGNGEETVGGGGTVIDEERDTVISD